MSSSTFYFISAILLNGLSLCLLSCEYKSVVNESNVEERYEFPVLYYVKQIDDQSGNPSNQWWVDSGISNQGGSNSGGSNSEISNQGGSNSGGSNSGISNQGGSSSGGSNSGGSNQEGGYEYGCVPLQCNDVCSYGYVVDEWGCFTCECNVFSGIECDDHDDCFELEMCISGYCEIVESMSTPYYCVSDMDCPIAYYCINGICE